MGLRVDIYRDRSYDCELNAFFGKSTVTVENIPGPFDPDDDAPAAVLTRNALGNPIITPRDLPVNMAGPMFGGTYAASSDSRFGRAAGIYGALPIHDRFETWARNEMMTR
jgi:hypothetical protein